MTSINSHMYTHALTHTLSLHQDSRADENREKKIKKEESGKKRDEMTCDAMHIYAIYEHTHTHTHTSRHPPADTYRLEIEKNCG